MLQPIIVDVYVLECSMSEHVRIEITQYLLSQAENSEYDHMLFTWNI